MHNKFTAQGFHVFVYEDSQLLNQDHALSIVLTDGQLRAQLPDLCVVSQQNSKQREPGHGVRHVPTILPVEYGEVCRVANIFTLRTMLLSMETATGTLFTHRRPTLRPEVIHRVLIGGPAQGL
jgi:hypothetical protein